MNKNNQPNHSAEFEDGMQNIKNGLDKLSPSTKERKQIGEMVRFMNRYANSPQIASQDEKKIKSWVKQGRHILERSSRINDCLCFRNYLQNMNDNKYRAFKRAMGVGVSLQAISHHKSGLTNSYWKETNKSLSEFSNIAMDVFNNYKNKYGIQTWFVLFNVIEALDEPRSPNLLSNYKEVVKMNEEYLLDCMNNSPGLQVYAYDLNSHGLIPAEIPEITASQRSDFETRILCYDLLGRLRRRENTSQSELTDTIPSQNPHIWAIARAWNRSYHDQPSGVTSV